MTGQVRRTLRVGLTGGIATGKSTVVENLRRHGVAVVDADALARAAVEPGAPGLAAIVEHFGADVLTADGNLDRKALGAIVFDDPAERRVLEAIVHPYVRLAIERWFEDVEREGRTLGIADIPLLFETGRAQDFDYVVVVACDAATQRDRLVARDNLSGPEADRRIASQWPIADKVHRADAVVWTDGTLADTARRTDDLVATLETWANASSRRRRASTPSA